MDGVPVLNASSTNILIYKLYRRMDRYDKMGKEKTPQVAQNLFELMLKTVEQVTAVYAIGLLQVISISYSRCAYGILV